MTLAAPAYVFGGGDAREQHRLLAAAYDPMTLPRLAETGVDGGWRCLDVGTGGGTVAGWLAHRVGPAGAVLATDLTPVTPSVTRHDITRDPLPDNAFDLIVARLVLRHLPARDEVLGRLARALRPGGWLQVDETDTTYQPCLAAPDLALYERFLAARDAVMARSGVDGDYGRRVAALMRGAGLVGVEPVSAVEVWRAGSPGLELLAHTTVRLRDGLVAAGMTDRQLAEVRELLAHPYFRASSSVFYSVHGRRPGQGRP
ncbi:class I SAM-dependent methyltransferase [Actinophytocola sp.]|uniref:class I SAM-dependent methyltransferase n=1 Tax=Actinophytocola sp. TaxID=1872138 RepID=UPI003D6BE461